MADEDRHTHENEALLALYNGVLESLDVMPRDSEWWAEVSQLRERIAATKPEWAKEWQEANL